MEFLFTYAAAGSVHGLRELSRDYYYNLEMFGRRWEGLVTRITPVCLWPQSR